ncbi:DHH family phosphoesterase [Candidatus Woesearchaeota archaeon]|nr:DHH family phosphoesterase [Candidatus Woesearchaeota archaeon]
MGLTPREYETIRDELRAAEKPFFLFHDDPDGLTSFLLLKHFVGKGYGMMVKAEPNVNDRFLAAVKSSKPDTIFIVDVALMQQSFVDTVKSSTFGVKNIVWIDHHQPVKLTGVKYFNPRLHSPQSNPPASYLCWKTVEGNAASRQDLWLAMVGIVSDWHMPEFADEFRKLYPDLLPKQMTAEEALFTTDLGKLGRIFSFMLKGPTSEAMACVRALEKVTDPYEILNRITSPGKFIYGQFKKINSDYEQLLADAKKAADKSSDKKFLIFTYKGKQSFSGDLANELLFLYPDRILVVGRERQDCFMLSFRARNVPVLPALKKALVGIDGYGGGHENASGGSVNKKDFERFIEQFKGEF